MRRHLILIFLGAFAILAIMFFLWFWLLRGPVAPVDNTGQLGEGGPRTPIAGEGNNVGGNIETPLGGGGAGQNNVGVGTNIQTPVQPGYGSNTTYTPPSRSIAYVPYSPGGVWVDGSYLSTTSVSGTGSPRRFTPTPINQLTDVDIAGTGYFPSTPNGSAGPGGGGGGLGIGIAVVGCAASLLGGVTGGAAGNAGAGVGAAAGAAAVPVNDIGTHAILTTQLTVSNSIESSEAYKENFLDCIARTIARAAIERITADVVDWINSGFEGKPAFVQDFRGFFRDVADQAAGEFISGSKLAFLCSPFQLQVKIAVSKSYAHRSGSGGGNENACTLSDVTNNIRSFIEGNFSQGGWPAFLEFTTVPTNNPFGAFMTVEAQLGNEIASIQAEARLELELGQGFLSSRETYACGPINRATGQHEPPCQRRITTPGSVIASAIFQTENLSQTSLLLADSFDEIIGALITQLMTRTLYGGLSNLSGNNGYANTFMNAQDAQAVKAAEALLANLQASALHAQQYGSVKQGSISDIQNSQNLLQSLANCWSVTASSSGLTVAQQNTVLNNMAMANTSITALEARVTGFNNDITRANAAIAKLEQFQTGALAAATKAEVDTIAASFESARNSGTIMSQADVTSAQQDRSALQAEMSSLNQTTNSQITQCYAFGN